MKSAREYADQIAAIHRELQIPEDYSQGRSLPLQPEAIELVEVGLDLAGRPRQLVPAVAQAWFELKASAASAGLEIQLISAYRSVAYQRGIIERKRARGLSWDEIFSLSAAPGYSEHHTGRAVDIGTPGSPPLELAFAETSAFEWLQRHAPVRGWRLSFPTGNPYGIAYEPWHWFCGPTASPASAGSELLTPSGQGGRRVE